MNLNWVIFKKKFYKIPHKSKNLLIRIISIFLNLEFVPSRYGIKMKRNWNDSTFRFCIFGSYGNFLSDFLSYQSEFFYFIDIGANQGLYSLIAARNELSKKVISLEPLISTYKLLISNINFNKFNSKIDPYNFGISNEEGEHEIYFRNNHSGGASLYKREKKTENKSDIIRLVDRRFFNNLKFDLNHKIIIKIDVEGHEYEVINEIINSNIIHKVESIFFECDESWIDVAKVKNLLLKSGFRKFRKIGKGNHYDILANK